MTPEPGLPTPKQAVLAWVFGLVLVALIGLLVAIAAMMVAVQQGLGWDRALSLVMDPAGSPLVTSPSWIALGIAANELAVAALLLRWKRRLRAPLAAIVPLTRPSGMALLGSVLLPFGLSPLAEVFGEFVRRALPLEITSDHLVTAVSRNTSPLLFGGILFAAAVLPA
ncbi:MAG TPA: hypothetical protein VFQ61_32850, partial [Polyangiaceae bacterium]|nr:hypothetical protein [Polyangiaceae bacterium]